MKAIFNLLIVALAVAAGWLSHPALVARTDAYLAKADPEKATPSPPEESPAPESPVPPTSSEARKLAEKLRKSPPSPGPASGQTASPASSPSNEMAGEPTPAAAVVDEFEKKYPLPVFKDINEITKEWSSIPSRAFPRTVKTLVPIQLEGPTGNVPLPENSQALAIGMTQGMLVLMKNRQEPARSMVPLANTDLKQTLTALYEKYKTFKINEVMQQRERARGLKAKANGASETEMSAAGPKPTVEAGGVIPAMVRSLRAKEITETSEERITAWGNLNLEQIRGTTYWTGTIQCTVDNAIFGPTPTELMALIREDKVVKWLYSGSKEEVQ